MKLGIGRDEVFPPAGRYDDDDDDDDNNGNIGEFDNQLFSMSSSGLSIEALLGVVEEQLGFNDSGSWWLDPDRTPVEVVDPQGTVDEGAIADVEAEVRCWLRDSFDRNPEYAERSYHLLDRLEELSRLNGLVAEVSLAKQANAEMRQRLANNGDELRGEGDYPMAGDKTIFHSTLSLAPSEGYTVTQPNGTYAVYKRDGSLDVTRRTEGSHHEGRQLGPAQQLHKGAAEAVRRAHHSRRVPLGELTIPSPDQACEDKNGAFSLPPKIPQLSKLSILPQLQKSQQLPLPSPRQLGKNKHDEDRDSSAQPPPNSVSSPNRRTGSMYRTYSKNQLQLLRNGDSLENSHSQPFLPTVSNLLRTSALTYSMANSDRSVDDMSRSFDRSAQSLGLQIGPTNPLSLSMSAAEAGESMDGPNWTATAVSSEMRSSLSVIRSVDVYEMARQQESNLRKHHSGGGSRGQLTGSNNSLTENLLGVHSGQRAGSFDQHSADSVRQSLDVGLSSRANRLQSSAEYINQKYLDETSAGNADPFRKLFSPAFLRANQNELGMKPVIDKAASQLEALRASRDNPSKMSLSRDGTLLMGSGEYIRKSADPIETESLTSHNTHCPIAESDPGQSEGNHFFPKSSDTPDAVTPDNLVTPLPVARLSSQKLFEQLEAKLPEVGGTFVERVKDSSLPGVGVSYDLKESTMVGPDAVANISNEHVGPNAVASQGGNATPSSRNSSKTRASALPRFTGSGFTQPGKSSYSRIPGFSNPIRPSPAGGSYQRTNIPTAFSSGTKNLGKGDASHLSRSRNTTVKAQAISGLGQDAGHPRVHQSATSPVRSTTLRNPRLGKQPGAKQSGR